jgi:hypothetical protein
MPRVLVVTDGPEREIIMSERVAPDHLDTAHARDQLVERLAWGIDDAVCAERRSGAFVRPRETAAPQLEVSA